MFYVWISQNVSNEKLFITKVTYSIRDRFIQEMYAIFQFLQNVSFISA